MLQRLRVGVIGAKHLRDGRPCQDELLIERDGITTAVVVADGHGSSVHAEIGARMAVDVAAKALLAFAANLGTEHRGDLRAVHNLAQDPFRRLLVREWVRRIQEHAGNDTVDLKDYGSTLLFALFTRRRQWGQENGCVRSGVAWNRVRLVRRYEVWHGELPEMPAAASSMATHLPMQCGWRGTCSVFVLNNMRQTP